MDITSKKKQTGVLEENSMASLDTTCPQMLTLCDGDF